jgi:hypothetical protein
MLPPSVPEQQIPRVTVPVTMNTLHETDSLNVELHTSQSARGVRAL